MVKNEVKLAPVPTVKSVAPVKVPAKAPTLVKVPGATAKGVLEKEVKATAKTTEKVCAEINKKVLHHKSATLPEVTLVNGICKAELLKIIEHLDAMGTATYNTACALRDLHNRMK